MFSRYFFKVGDNHPLVEALRQFLYARWYLKSPPVKICSTVFDSSMQSLIAAYRKHHRLDQHLNIFALGSILDVPTYEQIGTEMSDAEVASAALDNIEIKQL